MLVEGQLSRFVLPMSWLDANVGRNGVSEAGTEQMPTALAVARPAMSSLVGKCQIDDSSFEDEEELVDFLPPRKFPRVEPPRP